MGSCLHDWPTLRMKATGTWYCSGLAITNSRECYDDVGKAWQEKALKAPLGQKLYVEAKLRSHQALVTF